MKWIFLRHLMKYKFSVFITIIMVTIFNNEGCWYTFCIQIVFLFNMITFYRFKTDVETLFLFNWETDLSTWSIRDTSGSIPAIGGRNFASEWLSIGSGTCSLYCRKWCTDAADNISRGALQPGVGCVGALLNEFHM